MNTTYHTIEKAIHYIRNHFREQPDLDAIAKQVYMSPFHFQRLFQEWAGVSPKKFQQFLTLEYAKKLLAEKHSLADTSFETGLSGTSRLHDLFVRIEGMTPGEYKNGGAALQIHYSHADSPFGEIIIASTPKGICHLSFADAADQLAVLTQQFPNAHFIQKTDFLQQQALQLFSRDWTDLQKIKLHIKGSPFQLQVWRSLLKIPVGAISTYSAIADAVQNPRAVRATGTAIGHNPVAFLIPCHRVLQSSGQIGQYHWGSDRKAAILGWEAAAQVKE